MGRTHNDKCDKTQYIEFTDVKQQRITVFKPNDVTTALANSHKYVCDCSTAHIARQHHMSVFTAI
jgi:hypothetical protein